MATDARIIPCPYGCDPDGLVMVGDDIEWCPLCGGERYLTAARYHAYMTEYSNYLNRYGFVYPLDIVTVIDLNERIRDGVGI